MEDLLAVVGHSLHGTGISPERAFSLASGDEPTTEHERRVAYVLRSGWTAAEQSERILSTLEDAGVEQ